MNHQEKYKEKAQVPLDCLKQIQAGRLKGMSDIKPQWRIQALTELYGLCGFGWYTEVTKEEVIEGSDGQKVVNVNINLYVRVGDEWSKPIFGSGGNKLVDKERNGLYTSDEALKMAHTDALSVACKMIGIGSDIYMGRFDGSKYANPKEDQKPPENPKPKHPAKPKPSNEAWKKTIEKLKTGEGDKDAVRNYFTLSPEQEKELTEL